MCKRTFIRKLTAMMAKAISIAWVAIIATEAEVNMIAVVSQSCEKLHHENKNGLELKK